MKRFLLVLLGTALVAGFASGQAMSQAASLDPLRFLPPGAQSDGASEWLAAYSREFIRLTGGASFTPAALRSAEAFCRAASFPDDPVLAARLVDGVIRRSDLRLRRGVPVAAIRAEVASAWKEEVHGRSDRAAKDKDSQRAEKNIKKDMSIAGGLDQSLPRDKDHTNNKLKDKIKEKKEKK